MILFLLLATFIVSRLLPYKMAILIEKTSNGEFLGTEFKDSDDILIVENLTINPILINSLKMMKSI